MRRPERFGKWGRQNAHETVERGRFHIKITKTWVGAAPDLWGRSSSVSTEGTLVDLAYASLNPAVTKRLGTAPCRKAVMLRRSWQAGLQLEVAKCIATAARREELGCRSYRRASWEAGHSGSSLDKWLLREEVAERRGASAKRSLSEDALKDKQLTHPSVHPSIHHASIHPSCNSFIGSFIRSLTDSLIHWFICSLVHWFIESLINWSTIHCFIASLVHWFIRSLTSHLLIRWFVDSLTKFTDSLIHWLVDSLIHWFSGWLIHWFIGSLFGWFIDLLIHRIIDSQIGWFTDSLIHWFIVSLVPWFIGSLLRWFADSLIQFSASLIHWFIDSLLHSFSDSLFHCVIDSLILWFCHGLIHCLIQWFIASFLLRFTDSWIYWLMDSSIHWFIDSFSQLCMDSSWPFSGISTSICSSCWCTSQLQHFVASASQNNPIGHLFPVVVFLFSKLRPGGHYWKILSKEV